MTAVRSNLLILLACVAPLLLASPGRAQTYTKEQRDQASERFSAGVELVRDRDFEAALVEFRRAYEIAPDWRILFNMGQVLQMMQRYPEAVRHFEQYLREGGQDVAEARREQVLEEINRLKARVAYLVLDVSEPSAEVYVDDEKVGTTPLTDPVAVSVGRRKVVVRKSGFAVAEQTVEVGGRETKTLTFDLEAETPERAAAPVARTDAPEAERPMPWVAWGAAGALAVGAAVTGVLALGAKGDAEDEAKNETTKGKLDDAEQKAFILGLTTDALIVGAVGVGAFALWRTLSGKPDTEEEPVSVGISHRSLTLRARF